MATRKARKTRRAGPTQSHLRNFLPKRFFKSNLTRQNGKRNIRRAIEFKEGTERGYRRKNLNNSNFNLTNFNNSNLEYANNLHESRIGDPRRTPTFGQNVRLNPEESRKYAELYHNYVLNNSTNNANSDERFIHAIDSDDSISKNTKNKFLKHFLFSH
jgi:hypothetical protein